MAQAGNDHAGHVHRTTPAPRIQAFSLMRAGLPLRLTLAAGLSTVVWVCVLWALG